MRAEISWGVYRLPSTSSLFQSSPMCRLIDRNVRSGLVMAWRLATSPTRTSPLLENATTDGVVREPSALGTTTGSPPSRTATTEFVVPRSMPTALGMGSLLFSWSVQRVRSRPGEPDHCAPGYARPTGPGNQACRKLERQPLKLRADGRRYRGGVTGTGDGRVAVDVLGALRVRDPSSGADRTPPGELQRRLLALLVLERGREVSTDRAVEALWPTRPPRDPAAALQTHVFRLRQALPDGTVISSSRGYVLVGAGVDVDADRL